MKNIETITAEERRTEIAYKRQALLELKDNIPEESKAMTYEERVQTSSTGESYAERTAVRITDKLLKEQWRKLKEIADIEEEIRNIEADNVIIGDNIGGLRKRDFEFLETKYKKELPEWRVGVELHMPQSQVNRKKQRIIENVVRWDIWSIIENIINNA